MTYTVTVNPSGRSFDTEPNQTLLESAVQAGVNLPYGCKDGVCSACKCQKIAGEVELQSYSVSALSDAERAHGWILACRAVAKSDVTLECKQVTDATLSPPRKMPVRVNSLTQLSDDVMQILLQLPANEAFAYRPGQFLDIILRDGTRRSYSMGSHQVQELGGAKTVELHVRHMPGGRFTDYVFGAIKAKEILRIEGPLGSCYLRNGADDAARPIVLLASGTGFAPIRALLQQLAAESSRRPISLYWGGRRPQDLYMLGWLQSFAAEHLPHLNKVLVISDALPEDAWTGRTGLVHQAVLDDVPDLSQHQVYACGAPVMVLAAQQSFTAQGQLPPEQFYADSFVSAKDVAQASASVAT